VLAGQRVKEHVLRHDGLVATGSHLFRSETKKLTKGNGCARETVVQLAKEIGKMPDISVEDLVKKKPHGDELASLSPNRQGG